MIRKTTVRFMGLIGFIKATVIGGVFVLAPIVILAMIIGKAVSVAYEAIHPLVQWLPFTTIAGVSLSLLLGIAALVLLCFLAGLLAHTTLAQWLIKSIENAILANLPGYLLMKSMGEGMAGVASKDGRRAVLVHFADSAQIGFLMDELADGRGVVFIPNVPSPWSGQLHVVPADRLEPIAAGMRDSLECLQRLGLNARRVVASKLPSNPGESPV